MSEVFENEYSWPQVSYARYNASRGGRAPGYLRDALVEAIEETWQGDRSWWEVVDIVFVDSAKQIWWEQTPASERGEWLLGQLWNCTNIVPGDVWTAVGLPRGKTFARLVRILKARLMDSQDCSESSDRET